MILSRLRTALFHLLLVACLVLLAGVAGRHPWEADWSDQARNLADPSTRALLGALDEAVHITAFAPDHPVLRADIEALVARLRRSGGTVGLSFVDPVRQPDAARAAGIRRAGELVVAYAGQQERVATADEYAIADALARLARHGTPWVVSVAGHGERDLLGAAPTDLGRFANLLEGRGYRVLRQSLSDASRIPDNAALVVLAAPQDALHPAELERLTAWLEAGGALLWLAEPPQPVALAAWLGVAALPGQVVDAAAADVGLDDPTFAVAAQHPEHPALAGIDAPLLFAGARALALAPRAGWESRVLASSSPRSWNETGPVRGEVRRDGALGERPGPLPLAAAFTRPRDGGEQRVVVVGDADWASNAALGQGANRRFALALVHWLTAEQRLLQVPVRQARDQRIAWPARTAVATTLWWLLAVPLLLVLTGVGLRLRRARG